MNQAIDEHSEGTDCCDTSPDATQEELLTGAVAKAEEVLRILSQEAEVLKSFNNQELLTLITKKELMVRELLDQITALGNSKGEQEGPRPPAYARLKTCLGEIDRLNQSNQRFIESSLTYFDEFLGSFCPSNYAPGQDGPVKYKPANLKGLSFRKEI